MREFDDDMGELFRNASADIRLKAAEDDWNLIKCRLVTGSALGPVTDSKINNPFSQRSILTALLLIGLTIIIAVVPVNKMHTNLNAHRMYNTGKQYAKTNPRISFAFSPVSKKTGKQNYIKEKGNGSILPDPEILASENFPGSKDLLINDLLIPNPISLKKTELIINAAPDLSTFEGVKGTDNRVENDRDPFVEKKFYAGIIAGPQFSETKNQDFSHAGLSAGILLGFHINKKLALETGFFISNKQYSSAGAYFDVSKISASMPSGMKLIQVNSNTRVIEIPVSLKYNILETGNSGLFISGGVSSYILTSEQNLYQASLNGNNETMTGNYFTNQNYFAASIHLSVGYEYKVSKTIKIRIEPYFQIPLKTMGMGSMYVQSTGVNLGFTIPIIK